MSPRIADLLHSAARCRRIAVYSLLALVVALASSSCKRAESPVFSRDASQEISETTDLLVTAHFVKEADDVPGFFRALLPDSGIVPVYVAVRNAGSRTLVIHSANGMGLDSGFNGFVFTAGGNRYLPVHPREAVARLVGEGRARRFKPAGAFGLFIGRIIPPLGGYYIYGEVRIGRFYRPLFSKSLYPALPSGMFKPIVLGPGETRTGYLYFAVESGAVADSVTGIDSRKHTRRVAVPFPGTACELSVQACIPIGAAGSVAGYDFTFAGGRLFALIEDAGPRGGLAVASVGGDPQNPFGPFESVGAVSSKTGRIADAAVRGDTAAVGVNFRSKSKLCLGLLGEDARPLAGEYFTRGVERVMIGGGGVFVLTDDGFCHLLSRGNLKRITYARLGPDVDDVILLGDTLFAFDRRKGLVLFAASRDNAFVRQGGRRLSEGRRRAVGLLDDKLVVLNEARESAGDTISLWMREAMCELRRMVLPGHVVAAACDGSALLVQLEEGTLIKLVPAELASLRISEAGFAPFAARALTLRGEGFVAVGSRGEWAAGSIGDYAPGRRGALEVAAAVR